MYKNISKKRSGFTLIELLTVIAIIGILASIIIPTVGKVQRKAQQTVDLNNLKQILQASMVFASDNNQRFPGITVRPLDGSAGTVANTPWLWAGVLAKSSGVTDASFYMSKLDTNAPDVLPTRILNDTKTGIDSTFGTAELSVEMVGGVRQADAPTTPIVYTRGLLSSGKWDATKGVYNDEGGHIGFVGGNVAYYKDTQGDDGQGSLTGTTGAKATDIKAAVKTTQKIYGTTNASIGSTSGTSGSGT